MITEIIDAIEAGREVEAMSTKEWYIYLLNKYILEESVQENGSVVKVPKKCKIEVEYTKVDKRD